MAKSAAWTRIVKRHFSRQHFDLFYFCTHCLVSGNFAHFLQHVQAAFDKLLQLLRAVLNGALDQINIGFGLDTFIFDGA